jgi:hypothetical protein
VRRYDDLGFVTLEFRKRDDSEICLNLDGTEYSGGFKMKILRVKRFIDQWNDDVAMGKNPAAEALGHKTTVGIGKSNFSAAEETFIMGEFGKNGPVITTTSDGKLRVSDS